ncbi:MAG: FAD-dependent oxidoreductase [Alphaproteobacteria bacterium]|nr:FAD-dependent oxidoreductase [Alphaproteobacteria bacterium]
MAADRLDAIVIGAGVEGLTAAVALARAGLSVIVVEKKLSLGLLGQGRPAVVSTDTARALDLTSHGVRFAPPSPVVGLSGDEHVVVWPEEHAARAGLAALSQRDAEAYSEFRNRIARAARSPARMSSPVAWLTSVGAVDDASTSPFWLSSIEHALDEAFDSGLVKGLWAQGAIMGTGVSPSAPMSASLFTRTSLLSNIAPELAGRAVAGGRSRLIESLASQFTALGGELRLGAEATEIIIDRDAAQGAELVGGVVLRAPLVLSSLDPRRSYLMLVGLRRLPQPVVRQMMGARAEVRPGIVRLALGAAPPFPKLEPEVLAAAPTIRINPGIEGLARAHGAFRRRALSDEISLEVTTRPLRPSKPGDAVAWELVATVPYLPAETTEGPWSAGRREKLRDLTLATLESAAPGLGAIIEDVEVFSPPEPQANMGPNGAALLQANASSDPTTLPRPLGGPPAQVLKNLVVLERNIFASDGTMGLMAARTVAGGKKGRLRA